MALIVALVLAVVVPLASSPTEPPAKRDPERKIVVVALQAGSKHSAERNPGLEANFNLLAGLARQAAAAQPRPDLICFPEYAISGWPYPPEEKIHSLAESIPGEGPWYRRYRELAREIGVPILCALVESADGKLYNTAFLLDAQGQFKGKYRKVQANLGEQTWWGLSQGERFELIELDSVHYGVSICADMWFPETVRCQELLGADVILHQSIGDDMGHIVPARAFDSKLPIVMAIFQGGCYAVDGEGRLLGKLPRQEPGWKAFTLHPFRRHLGKKYGGVWDIKKGFQNLRNVWAYSVLTDPSRRPPWTEVFMDNQGRPQTREQLLQRFHGRYDAHDPSPPGSAAPAPDAAAERDPERTITVVAVQAGSKHYADGNPGAEANFSVLAGLARQAAAAQPRPDVICFPEFAISGWPYPGEEQIHSLAESIPGSGPWYRRYQELAREIGVPILGAVAESGEHKLYTTAFLLDGQGGFKGKYRKVQASLGEQTWWGVSQGERFDLIELDGVRYGVSICADMFLPETVRCQELLGADVILHQSIGDDMGHIVPTRAFDSKLPIVMTIFKGGCYAVDAKGKLLGKLPAEDPGWKAFTLHPFRRHLGKKYGGVWDIKKGDQNLRNVSAYSVLTDPSRRPPWTEVFMDNQGRPQTREQLLERFRGRWDAHDPTAP